MKLIKFCFTTATLHRSPFATLSADHLSSFRSFLSPSEILTESLDDFNTDYFRSHQGSSSLVLLPTSTQSVSKILKFCNDNNLAVVPQGGNTGLVGGSTPIFDEIVVSTKKMNKIERYDEVSSVLSCQAGCILENLNSFLGQYGYEVPLDLGAKGSCHIGGNLSTHAGGKFFIKYGPLRANVLGIEAVLADGTVLDMRSTIRKDNTGIDMKQLFIGSEGTLGMITSMDINCVKVDTDKQVLLLKTTSFSTILEAVQIAKKILGKDLGAIQFFDYNCYHTVTTHAHKSVVQSQPGDLFLLIQTSQSKIQPLFSALPTFQQSIISTNQKQYLNIWRIREDIAEVSKRIGKRHYSFDASFDITQWDNFIAKQKKSVGNKGRVLAYGHIGDGNLHLNVCMEKQEDAFDQMEMFKEIVEKNGSISAEHGIGAHKRELMKMQKPANILQLTKKIKNVFDPKGILNPYKMYP